MNLKNFILVFSLILCILFSISCVAAGDVNDTVIASDADDVEMASSNENQTIGEVSNDFVASRDDGTFTALQEKINKASDGGVIDLENDYSYNDGFKNPLGIYIDKSLTINGNGHTIDAKSKSRIFTLNYGNLVNGHKVTFKDITFKNAKASIYGGAILNFADLTVENCNFQNNYAGTAGGAINSLGSLNLKNSKFDKNVADGDAGAVFSLTIKKGYEFYRDYFGNNSVSEDSNLLLTIVSLALEPGKDTISGCQFTNNVANGNGGAGVYAFSHIDISSCTFTSNSAGEKGAAVFGCKDLFIKNSDFTNNKVGMYGGAVYFKCHEQTGKYVDGKWVSSVKFYSNLIESSTFSNNVAGERGGAIYGFKASASDNVHCAKAVKCTFSDNKAPNGKDIYGGTVQNCVYKNTKITLKTAKVKKSAKKLVLQATLKKGTSPLKGKQVTFKFNGKTYKAKTNSKGVAKVTVKKSVLKKLKVGKKVKYQASYSSFVAKKTAKVKK